MLAVALDVIPLFGAFVAGIVVGSAEGTTGAEAARGTIKDFSFAFFIPLYFAIVGLRLDLLGDFEPLFFLLFLAIACLAKYVCVWAGARWAGESAAGLATSPLLSMHEAARESCSPRWPSTPASSTAASTQCS